MIRPLRLRSRAPAHFARKSLVAAVLPGALALCAVLMLAGAPAAARTDRAAARVLPDAVHKIATDSKTKAKAKAKAKDAKGKGKDAKGKDAKGKTRPKGKDKAAAKGKDGKAGGNKPRPVGTYGAWGAYIAQSGKAKTCYALASPKTRAPASLKRDPGYVFISTRPAEGVHNEVSVIVGFDVKDGTTPKATIGSTSFDMVAKGANLWVRNAAEEGAFIAALKKGSQLQVRAVSKRGNTSTDTYVLTGITQALEHVRKECP